jgi:hypothetical protein
MAVFFSDEQEELEAMVARVRVMADGLPDGSFLKDAMIDLAESMNAQVKDMVEIGEAVDWSSVTGWPED